MRDEIYDRDYQAGRADLHAGIDRAIIRFGRRIAATFDTLHAVQWSAPWHQPSRGAGKRPGHA